MDVQFNVISVFLNAFENVFFYYLSIGKGNIKLYDQLILWLMMQLKAFAKLSIENCLFYILNNK